jgi:hypothetical protein
MLRAFTISVQTAITSSQYSWRLKDSEIRFRGSGEYAQLVTRRIPASDKQVDDFFAAIELIQVWDWRSDYHPNDVGLEVFDGSVWSFMASDGARECRCGGVNAYPSFADPNVSTTNRGRFAMLHAAFYDCFGISSYVQEARQIAEALRHHSDVERAT